MQAPNWTDFLQCCVCTNKFNSTQVVPISLSCSHTLCTRCLGKLKTRMCPYDKTVISTNTESLPPNTALLRLLGEEVETIQDLSTLGLSDSDLALYCNSKEAIEELAMFLQPLAEQGITAAVGHLTKPMLKKLVTVVNCQMLEIEGRARALRAARSIADRTITELLVMHQNQQQISSLLWTAVRNRGCQFLGPVMQEEALKLILKVLEGGTYLARKTIVMYVVQQLLAEYPQASKTSVGHVVQLLYRASCFNVEKREDDSSLMQLKEEFRSYESLRREHDSQIIRMAMEAGLRISPEQWSSLLYGDHKHKSDMQSIIDKLISQGAASSGLSELIVSIERSQDQYNLSEKIIPQLEVLLKVDINIDKTSEMVSSWKTFSETMHALLVTLQGFSTFMQIQSGRYKTGMCPFLTRPGGCPKGNKCTYAHTEQERDHYRDLVKNSKVAKSRPDPFSAKPSTAPVRGGVVPSARLTRHSGEIGMSKLDGSPYSSMSSMGYDSYASGFSSGGLQDAYHQEGIQHVYPGDGMMAIMGQPAIPTDPTLQVLPAPAPANYVVLTPSPSTAPHHHSGPIATASVPQEWYEKPPSGVVMTDQSYYMAQRGNGGGFRSNTEYQPVEDGGRQLYQRNLSTETPNAVPPMEPYSLTAVESIRRKHETVKRSIEATQHDPSSSYIPSHTSPEVTTSYTTPTSVDASSLYYHSSHSAQPDVTAAAVSAENTSSTIASSVSENYQQRSSTSSDWRQDSSSGFYPNSSADHQPYPVSQEWLGSHEVPRTSSSTGGYEEELQSRLKNQLEITTSSSTYGRGYPNSEQQQHTASAYNGNQKSMSGVYSYSTSRSVTVTSGSSYPVVSTPRSMEDELRERIRQLEQQVQDKDKTIEVQQMQMKMNYSGPKTLAQDVHQSVGQGAMRPNHHHSGPIHNYSGPVLHHYSPQNTMQQYPVYVPQVQGAGGSLQGTGGAYYAATYPHQYSGPLSGPPTAAHYQAPRITPPNTGFLVHSSPIVQLPPTHRADSNDDLLLAAYLQQVEQEKAAPNVHHHYGYGLQATPQVGQPPRYHYKYTY